MGINIRSLAPIVEMTQDPSNPTNGQNWVKVEGLIGQAGQAMGVMGLTYTQQVADKYLFKYRTNEFVTKQVELI